MSKANCRKDDICCKKSEEILYKKFKRNFRIFFIVTEDAYYERYLFFAFMELSHCIFFS